ncbi:MAG: 50S ribosomal protein L13 [Aeriscardovia sp.]|nr:50S ribosomal protein L13 [Aeriscardovia sp.]
MKTFTPKPSDLTHDWYVIDADGVVLGRLASQIADILRGKKKPTYAPNADLGDFVIIVNADKVVTTGKKDAKVIYHHSSYPGGLRATSYAELRAHDPERMFKAAVWGMMPKNKLSRKQITRLRVFVGNEHPYASQKPQTIEISKISQGK